MPYQVFGRQVWHAGFDERMQPLCHGAILAVHVGDLRQRVAFAVYLRSRTAACRRLLLFGALPHRGLLRIGEALC